MLRPNTLKGVGGSGCLAEGGGVDLTKRGKCLKPSRSKYTHWPRTDQHRSPSAVFLWTLFLVSFSTCSLYNVHDVNTVHSDTQYIYWSQSTMLFVPSPSITSQLLRLLYFMIFLDPLVEYVVVVVNLIAVNEALIWKEVARIKVF